MVTRVPMTRPHYEIGRMNPRMIVVHATAGTYPGDYNWLKRGGGETNGFVSCHYYIRKNGEITQFVDEEDIAWHCGSSSWMIDGKQVVGCNRYAIGMELENRNNGSDPYPLVQRDACAILVRDIRTRHTIPLTSIVRHRDISPGRKTDPLGFPWEEWKSGLGSDEGVAAVYYTLANVNLRFAPSLTAHVLAVVPYNERCETTQTDGTYQATEYADGVTWRCMTWKGRVGWIADHLLRKI